MTGGQNDTVIWLKGVKRTPAPTCKHNAAAIVQPGDWDRLRFSWLRWCDKCKSLHSASLRRRTGREFVRRLT